MPLQIIRNDITQMAVDAIVNATDIYLSGSGGVDREIHKAAGMKMELACRRLHSCETGEVKITAGYDLPCKYVIHTVGSVWHGGNDHELQVLARCYDNALHLAQKHHCRTVAFPVVSSGTFGFPKDLAIRTATNTIQDFLLKNEMTVYLVVYDSESFGISARLFANIQQYIDDHSIDKKARESWDNLSHPLREAETSGSASLASEAYLDSYAPRPCAALPEEPPAKRRRLSTLFPALKEKPDLKDYLSQLDEGFRGMLLRLIDEKGMTDAECYKKANIDRKLFNKIKNQADYKPSKPTVVAFAIALELPLEQTKEMLSKAGFSLSHSSKFDLIIEYFIQQGNYNIFEINEALFSFDQNLLGNGVA